MIVGDPSSKEAQSLVGVLAVARDDGEVADSHGEAQAIALNCCALAMVVCA
jgi:hypothetical protein